MSECSETVKAQFVILRLHEQFVDELVLWKYTNICIRKPINNKLSAVADRPLSCAIRSLPAVGTPNTQHTLAEIHGNLQFAWSGDFIGTTVTTTYLSNAIPSIRCVRCGRAQARERKCNCVSKADSRVTNDDDNVYLIDFATALGDNRLH